MKISHPPRKGVMSALAATAALSLIMMTPLAANADDAPDATDTTVTTETTSTPPAAPEPEEQPAPDPAPVTQPDPPAEEEPSDQPADSDNSTTEPEDETSTDDSVEEVQTFSRVQNVQTTPDKVLVCKYVGTPGVDEVLKAGKQPISVSISSIQNNQWDGTVPGYFSDAHDRSYVVDYDNGQELDSSDCPAPPPVTCVVTASFTHTYNGATNSGVITATGEFCGKTLYVTPTEWAYTGNTQWPQNLVDYVPDPPLEISAPGEYAYGNPVACGQGDIYAQWDNPIIPTATLSGPSVEFDEHFLHEVSTGPTTWVVQGTSCWTPPPPACVPDFDPSTGYVNPDETGHKPTQVANGLEFGKGDLIHFSAGLVSAVGLHDLAYTVESTTGPTPAYKMEVLANGSSGYGTWNWEAYRNGYATNATGSFTNLENGKWWSSKIASGPGSQSQPIPYNDLVAIYGGLTKIISFGTGVGTTTESTAVVSSMTFLCGTGDFTNPPTKVEPDDPTMVDSCGTANDSFTLPGAQPGELESVTAEGTYTADELPNVDGTVVVTFVPAANYEVVDDPDGVYEVDNDGNAVWTLVFTDEDCPIAVTPDGPTKVDSCGTANDTFTLPGAQPGETESVTLEGTYSAVGDPTKGEDVIVTFVPASGHTVDPSTDDSYEVNKDGNAVWTLVFTDEDCPTKPPTQSTDVLSMTGGSDPSGPSTWAAVAVLLGVLMVVTTVRHSRRQRVGQPSK